MKKVALNMMILPLALGLAACNGENGTRVASFVFDSDYCYIDTTASEFIKNQEQTFTMKIKDDFNGVYALPEDVHVLIGSKVGTKGSDYTYNVINDEAKITMRITANTVIQARYVDSDNIYRVSKEQFDSAVAMENIDYLQSEYTYTIFTDNIFVCNYLTRFTSPTVYSESRITVQGNNSNKQTFFVEKDGTNYWKYSKEEEVWGKTAVTSDDFKVSSDSSPASMFEFRGIDFDAIADNFDSGLCCYRFNSVQNNQKTYNFTLLFMYGKLVTCSYEVDALASEYGSYTYTYGEYTPTLPSIE